MAAIVERITGFSIPSAVIPNICIFFLPGAIFFLISEIRRFSGVFFFWIGSIAIGLEWLLVSETVCFPFSEILASVKASSPRIPTV